MLFETARLVLRRWELADLDAAMAIYGDPEAMRYFGRGVALSYSELEASLNKVIETYALTELANYCITEKAGGAIIGHSGVHASNLGDEEAEADWAIARPFWGRGYATEAARALFEHAFRLHGLSRIWAVAHRDNAPSFAVMKKLGMRFSSQLMRDEAPSVSYVVTREEFLLL